MKQKQEEPEQEDWSDGYPPFGWATGDEELRCPSCGGGSFWLRLANDGFVEPKDEIIECENGACDYIGDYMDFVPPDEVDPQHLIESKQPEPVEVSDYDEDGYPGGWWKYGHENLRCPECGAGNQYLRLSDEDLEIVDCEKPGCGYLGDYDDFVPDDWNIGPDPSGEPDESKRIHFFTDGESITRLARQMWLGGEIPTALKVLLNHPPMTECMAVMVLTGKKKLVGYGPMNCKVEKPEDCDQCRDKVPMHMVDDKAEMPTLLEHLESRITSRDEKITQLETDLKFFVDEALDAMEWEDDGNLPLSMQQRADRREIKKRLKSQKEAGRKELDRILTEGEKMWWDTLLSPGGESEILEQEWEKWQHLMPEEQVALIEKEEWEKIEEKEASREAIMAGGRFPYQSGGPFFKLNPLVEDDDSHLPYKEWEQLIEKEEEMKEKGIYPFQGPHLDAEKEEQERFDRIQKRAKELQNESVEANERVVEQLGYDPLTKFKEVMEIANDEEILNPDYFESAGGWLSPSGDWYSCHWMEHNAFATRLVEQFHMEPRKYGKEDIETYHGFTPAEQLLDEAGWMKILAPGENMINPSIDHTVYWRPKEGSSVERAGPTRKQQGTIWDWYKTFQINKFEYNINMLTYKEWLEHIEERKGRGR